MIKLRALTSKNLLQSLKRHYMVPLHIPFRQFRNGLIYFAVGLMSIIMANQYMAPSLAQELVVLFGLILGSAGFMIAMLAQMRILISRITQFFLAHPTKSKP